MIIVKVVGGLGNQMFQLAYAKALSLELSEELYVDDSLFDKYKVRGYSADNLYITENVENKKNANKYSTKIYRIFQKIKKIIFKTDIIGEKIYQILCSKGMNYNFDRYYYEAPLTKHSQKVVYGYFQSEKYFEKYESEIKKNMKVRTLPNKEEQLYIDKIKTSNYRKVAISIRLGEDYINSKELNVCSKNYYYKAIDIIVNKYKRENIELYIFSDCIEEVEKKFNFQELKCRLVYIKNMKDYQSLRLMYLCEDFIISNSSFSWWGAYLSENINKTIIAPSRWYNNSAKKPDIYTANMILVNPE